MPIDACVSERLLCVEKAINHSAVPAPSTIKAIGQELLFWKSAALWLQTDSKGISQRRREARTLPDSPSDERRRFESNPGAELQAADNWFQRRQNFTEHVGSNQAGRMRCRENHRRGHHLHPAREAVSFVIWQFGRISWRAASSAGV